MERKLLDGSPRSRGGGWGSVSLIVSTLQNVAAADSGAPCLAGHVGTWLRVEFFLVTVWFRMVPGLTVVIISQCP